MFKIIHVKKAKESEDPNFIRVETNLVSSSDYCAIMGGDEDSKTKMVKIYRPHCDNTVVLCEEIILKAAEFINKSNKSKKPKK